MKKNNKKSKCLLKNEVNFEALNFKMKKVKKQKNSQNQENSIKAITVNMIQEGVVGSTS